MVIQYEETIFSDIYTNINSNLAKPDIKSLISSIYTSNFKNSLKIIDEYVQKESFLGNYKNKKYKKNYNGNKYNNYKKKRKETFLNKDRGEIDNLKKIINGNLNKLSPNNSEKIFLDILKLFEDNILIFNFDNFVDTLFEKAVMQPTYCPLYVKLFIIMNKKHKSLDKENGDKFTDLLIKKCNMFKNMIKEFSAKDDDILNPDNYDDFCEKNKEKVFKKGFSQFIGELYKNHFVNDEFMDEFLEGLVDSIIYNLDNKDVNIENSSICLIQLVETTMNKRQLFQKGIYTKINKIIKYKIIPKKIKFMFLDLLEDKN